MMLDENLPPALARSLSALFTGQHEIVHLREKFGPSVPDMEWIDALRAEGRWVILSGDIRIAKHKAEKQAFKAAGLIGFFLAPSLQKAPTTKKMERLMASWVNIEKQVDLLDRGSMMLIQGKGSKFTTL